MRTKLPPHKEGKSIKAYAKRNVKLSIKRRTEKGSNTCYGIVLPKKIKQVTLFDLNAAIDTSIQCAFTRFCSTELSIAIDVSIGNL